MLRRKDSFGYLDFIRGKYMPNNLEHLQTIFNEMSQEERERIQQNDFIALWDMMWGIEESGHSLTQYKMEEFASQKKFDSLKRGIIMSQSKNTELVTLNTLIEGSTTNWLETEWEFPKGRRNYQEKDLDCEKH